MANLKIPPERAIFLLNKIVNEIENMIGTQQSLDYYDFVGWCSKVYSMIDEIYGDDDPHPEEIRIIGLPRCSCSSSIEVQRMLLEVYHSHLLRCIDEIQSSLKMPE